MVQTDAKDAPKRLPEAPARIKKAIPNRKTIKGPNQDDPKTVLDLPGGGGTPSLPSPQGLHLGGQNGTKADPETIKNRSENSR